MPKGYFKTYKDRNQHNILAVGTFPAEKELLSEFVRIHGLNLFFEDKVSRLNSAIEQRNYHLVIVDLDAVGPIKPETLSTSGKTSPCPLVFLSGRSLEETLPLIFSCNAYILNKPLLPRELAVTIYAGINKRAIFGLFNYFQFEHEVDLRNFEINYSGAILPVCNELKDIIEKAGMSASRSNVCKLLAMELLTNAFYHAHDLSAEKKSGQPILLENNHIRLQVYLEEDTVGISVTDYRGRLSKKKLLNYCQEKMEIAQKLIAGSTAEQDPYEQIPEAGRGLLMLLQKASEVYINIQRRRKTELVFTLSSNGEKPASTPISRSLIINESYEI